MSVALTTKDNPFDPLTNFYIWNLYDVSVLRYNTCGLLASVAKVSNRMSQEEYQAELERAIDEIVLTFPIPNRYIKVERNG